MAHAYADASVALFEGIAENRLPETYHHALAATAAFEQALELFLKGSLVQAGDMNVPRTHELTQIFERFLKLYPGKLYAFSGRVEEAIKGISAQPAGQFVRYPVDVRGVPWPGNSHFTLSLWLEQVRAFRDDYHRLEPLLRQASTP